MNHLIVCGLNHHTTPIAIRERFVIPESCIKHALQGLSHFPHLIESAVVSTCNRTEVYAVVSNVNSGMTELDEFFLSVQSVGDHQGLKPNFKLVRDDVALHLMRVASGLDSMVLGEGQIMAQVKEAHRAAQTARTSGPVLDHLFGLALNCGKRVRSETSLGRRAVSVSSAAVELARELAPGFGNERCTILGAGKMARICLKNLLSDKSKGLVSILNRSTEKLQPILEDCSRFSHRISGDENFVDRHSLVAGSRLSIVATSAPFYLLEFDKFALAREAAVAAGASDECLIVDISVPRNVDPRIGELPGVTLKHADDLACIVNKNKKERQALLGEAEEIVFQALEEFQDWQRSRLVVPTIAGLREKIEAIRQEQMSKGSQRSGEQSGCPHKADAESLSRAIINQILHHPTVQLKATRDYQVLKQQAEALRTLFNLELNDGPKATVFGRDASLALS